MSKKLFITIIYFKPFGFNLIYFVITNILIILFFMVNCYKFQDKKLFFIKLQIKLKTFFFTCFAIITIYNTTTKGKVKENDFVTF